MTSTVFFFPFEMGAGYVSYLDPLLDFGVSEYNVTRSNYPEPQHHTNALNFKNLQAFALAFLKHFVVRKYRTYFLAFSGLRFEFSGRS